MIFLLKGIILGFSIAAPVGPIGILCIKKTLQFGRLSGFFSGLGAAVADMIYGAIAAFGLTLISNVLLAGQFWLKLLGGAFLIYIGLKTFFSKTKKEKQNKLQKSTLFNDFISTFFLTLTNPMTIFAFVAIFAGQGLFHLNKNLGSSTSLVIGVFLGSSLWWFLLSEFVSLFRKKIEDKMMIWINRIAGLIIASFGLGAVITIFSKIFR
jgi:threonine/homoserine/homoserine lactone efflux protein